MGGVFSSTGAMSKKLIVVVGATGNQGGSVASELLAKPSEYSVRALTRNPTSDKAKDLKNRGAEVVECNINNEQDLQKAFNGAYGVFGVTNAYDKELMQGGHDAEFVQGKKMVDAAAGAQVTHFIFSSLEDATKMSNGKYTLPHFTNKHKVEEYAKTKGFKYTTFPYPGVFLTNYMYFMKPTKMTKDGKDSYTYYTWIKPETKLPLTAVEEDIGPITVAAISNPEKYGHGTRINVARENMTETEFFKRVEKSTGIPTQVVYSEPPKEQNDEMTQMFRMFGDFGCYKKGDDGLDLTKQVATLKTVEDFIKDRKFSPAVYHQ